MVAQQSTDEPIETETVPDTDSETDSDLTRDDIFHVLQCRRRRLVLKYLKEYDGDGPARMGDIAEHIAALEHDTTVDALRSQQRQRVYIALYQSHLPKMDDDGVIDYNQSRGYVEATDLVDRFDAYLGQEPTLLGDEDERDEQPAASAQATLPETEADVEARWYKRYLYAAGGSLLVLASVSSGVASSLVPSNVGVGILVSALFTLLALSHWMTQSSVSERAPRFSSIRNWIP